MGTSGPQQAAKQRAEQAKEYFVSSSSQASTQLPVPLESLSKTFRGCIELGPNEVRTRTDCLKSCDKLFGSHMRSCPNSKHRSRRGDKAFLCHRSFGRRSRRANLGDKAAAAGKSKETEEETKGE